MEYAIKAPINDIIVDSVVEDGEYYIIPSTGDHETDERMKNYIIDSIEILTDDEPIESTETEQYYIDLFRQDFIKKKKKSRYISHM